VLPNLERITCLPVDRQDRPATMGDPTKLHRTGSYDHEFIFIVIVRISAFSERKLISVQPYGTGRAGGIGEK